MGLNFGFDHSCGTTVPNGYHHKQPNQQNQYRHEPYNPQYRNSFKNNGLKPSTTIDIGYSDETTDTQGYYDYYQANGFQHSPLRESRNTDCTFSDESSSTRLPYYEFDDESNKRFSDRERSVRLSKQYYQKRDKNNQPVHSKDLRRVYPNQDEGWDRLYQEIPSLENVPNIPPAVPKRIPVPSRLSDRPQSSMSSGMTSAVVYGCGGKCQTFENICYFFLQLVFTMGVLIGVSLCIAGTVLRKSAARNLQVLVYIGVLLAMVSGLLLCIQCNARSTAKRRQKQIQLAKRTIQMDTLNRGNGGNQEHLVMVTTDGHTHNHRLMPLPQVHQNRPLPHPHPPIMHSDSPSLIEEQGIPWWRRRDLEVRPKR